MSWFIAWAWAQEPTNPPPQPPPVSTVTPATADPPVQPVPNEAPTPQVLPFVLQRTVPETRETSNDAASLPAVLTSTFALGEAGAPRVPATASTCRVSVAGDQLKVLASGCDSTEGSVGERIATTRIEVSYPLVPGTTYYRTVPAGQTVLVDAFDPEGALVAAYRIPVLAPVDRAVTPDQLRVVLKLRPQNNAGSPATAFAFNQPNRINLAQITVRDRRSFNDPCTTFAPLACGDLEYRLVVKPLGVTVSEDQKEVASEWVQFRRNASLGIALRDAIQQTGQTFDPNIQQDFDFSATVYLAQRGAPRVEERSDHRLGERVILDEQFVTFGYDPRDRFTFGAYNVPGAVGVTALRCPEVLEAGDTVDEVLVQSCRDNPSRTVYSSQVSVSPVGARLRVAPLYRRPEPGVFADVRFLELGGTGFVNPNLEDRAGLTALASAGAGLDARIDIDERPFHFYGRIGGNLLVAQGHARVRGVYELGVAIPILTTEQEEQKPEGPSERAPPSEQGPQPEEPAADPTQEPDGGIHVP